MKKSILMLFAVIATFSSNAEIFKIDTSHAEIGFSVKHMMVSNTKGTFNTFEGTIDYDIESKSLKSIEGFIETGSIDTHNKKRDEHLQNEDFFNVVQFPKITFKSTVVKQTGDNVFDVTGQLSVLGVDHEITIPVTINGPADGRKGSKLIGLECYTTLNRSELGVGKPGNAKIGEEVKVNLDFEATYK